MERSAVSNTKDYTSERARCQIVVYSHPSTRIVSRLCLFSISNVILIFHFLFFFADMYAYTSISLNLLFIILFFILIYYFIFVIV